MSDQAKDSKEEIKEAPKEEIKEVVGDTPKEESKEEKKEESKEEKKEDEPKKLKKISNSLAFVTENDTFIITSEYYSKDKRLFVKGIDEDYDESNEAEKLEVTVKCPDQGDSRLIQAQSKLLSKGDFSVEEVLNLEFTRLLVLIREWNLDRDINHESVIKIHPRIIKALIEGMREKIGMDGLI